MVTWHLNIFRRRPHPARYYQVFGREPEQSWPMVCAQCLVGGFKCIIYYGILYLIIKWYLWPAVVPNLMKYEFAQKTMNQSSILLDRLKPNRKILFDSD
ncbi:unnamed protein product [Adineta ricciae]|uniref:Uncharacterized protein n=1 Tax=Adineta ricciae TaxID=249248 RepID=A0A815RAN9_ADIRI|nr:unnamed protein product [Adineta ricciae]